MRDAILIFVAIILSMMVGSYLFFNGVPSSSPPVGQSLVPGNDTPFVVLAEGRNSGSVARRANFLIRSEEELIDLWAMVYGTAGPVRPLVDFSKYEVIGVFDGTRSSGGYRVEVIDVTEEGGKRIIHILREEPAEDCAVTDAISSPFQIVRVAKSNLPLGKEEKTETADCR